MQSSLNKRKSSKQAFYEQLQLAEGKPDGGDGARSPDLRNPGSGTHVKRDPSEPATPAASEQSIQANCLKFDQMRVRLNRRLAQRLSMFESERSTANRAKIQVADHNLSFRSTSRDLGEMRARAESDQQAQRAIRREHFRRLNQVVQLIRGPDNGSGHRDLTPNESAILQAIAGYLNSPYVAVLNHHSMAHLLEDVPHTVLADPAVLKILLEFISKVGITENDLRMALAASHHEFPATLFDLANIVRNNAVATMMGGLRSAGLAGRLLRKRKDGRMSLRY